MIQPSGGGQGPPPHHNLHGAGHHGAALLGTGCTSDPAHAQKIHDADQVISAQRRAGEELRDRLASAEKALAATRAENDRLRGSDEAFRAAQAALEARLKELEGTFPAAETPGEEAGVTVEKIEGGYKFVVQGEVLFGLGEISLTEEGQAAMAKIAAALKGRRESVRIEGHTDNVPIVKAETKAKFPYGNLDLSLQRSLVAADALITAGVEAKRVSCAGWGEYRPRADNGTLEGRKRNRRVEILVLEE